MRHSSVLVSALPLPLAVPWADGDSDTVLLMRLASKLTLASTSLLALAGGCGKEPQKSETPAVTPPLAAASTQSDAMAAPAEKETRSLSLSGDTPVPVPGTDLQVHISGGFHKASAPVVGVDILFQKGEQKVQVGWRIESGEINSEWMELRGRRYDDASSEYVDEEIPGWRVRLDSVDDQSAGGDPIAITISVKRAP